MKTVKISKKMMSLFMAAGVGLCVDASTLIYAQTATNGKASSANPLNAVLPQFKPTDKSKDKNADKNADKNTEKSVEKNVGTVSKSETKSREKTQTINKIAVVVNDEVITQQELDERMQGIQNNLKKQGTALPNRSELEKQVLERMIIDRLQVQLAKEQGMRVDDVMLDRALQRMAEQNKVTLQELRNQVEKEGNSFATFREEIRDEIMIQRVREREVDSRVQVSETEVDNFLATVDVISAKQELNLAHIMIRIPENATPEVIAQRNAKAQDIYKKLRIGEDFAKLAAANSDASEALKGGEVGWREQDKIPPAFLDAVNKIASVGGISEVVRSPSGFHILKLLGKREIKESQVATKMQNHVRHILMRPTNIQSAVQIKSVLQDLKKKIAAKTATFEELAKAHSVDASSSKGGDLGWVMPGDTFPEFEEVVNKLAINEVSDPVETQLGFHLIQVTERKVLEDSKEQKRAEARQAVRVRKSEEATQEWVRQLRDKAYVEFRNGNANSDAK